jgi:NAD(P)-dependent dehydrogenase (short-subunit alcohol dehydrogenase family)
VNRSRHEADRTKATAVVQSLVEPQRHLALVCDVSDGSAVASAVSEVERKFGKIDILISCAGVYYPTPIGETKEVDVDRMMDVDLKGPWNLVNAAAPRMKAQRFGKIVNVASMCGVMSFPGYAMYCAVKAGGIMMTRAMAGELAPHGIQVNSLAPGFTATPMNEDLRTQPEMKQYLDLFAARTSSGRTYSLPKRWRVS